MPDTCIICGEGPTVNSHLIPQAIAKDIRGDQNNFLIGSKYYDGKNFSKNGTFDQFLCYDHESALHDYENYAIDFVRDFNLTSVERSASNFSRNGVDTDALVRFAVSVIWRYHISDRLEAESVDVGEWEPALRQVTFGGDIAKAPEVLVLAVITDAIPANRFAIPPARSTFDKCIVWSFLMNGVCFMVKLDHRHWSPFTRYIVINGQTSIFGMVREMNQQDFLDMKVISDRMRVGGRMGAPRPSRPKSV